MWESWLDFSGGGAIALCYGLNCIPYSLYVDSLTLSGAMSGDRVYRSYLRLNDIIWLES